MENLFFSYFNFAIFYLLQSQKMQFAGIQTFKRFVDEHFNRYVPPNIRPSTDRSVNVRP